jgi:hypothetical protein
LAEDLSVCSSSGIASADHLISMESLDIVVSWLSRLCQACTRERPKAVIWVACASHAAVCEARVLDGGGGCAHARVFARCYLVAACVSHRKEEVCTGKSVQACTFYRSVP